MKQQQQQQQQQQQRRRRRRQQQQQQRRHFVTARVADFGIAFSIKFLSSSAFLGFRKVLEQDAMSSSVSRRKYKHV